MTPLLWCSSGRYLARHRWQSLLSILGITLGVAVVVAVDLANSSASRAFDLSLASLSGNASHQIIGAPVGFDEQVYTRLRVERGLRRSAPVVEGYAEIDGETVHLLGIDPLAERGFRGRLLGLDGGQVQKLLVRPDTALISASLAERFDLQGARQLDLHIAGQPHQLELLGRFAGGDAAAQAELIVVDIATAQELFAKPGRLDRIDLKIDGPAEAQALRTWLPPGLQLLSTAASGKASHELTRAFRINLQAMSLLALMIGAFLIYNTMTFAVLRRRQLLGSLRVLGVGRSEVFRLVLGEALAIGLLGTLLGCTAGLLLGQGLVQLVTRTINDLYFVLTVTEFLFQPLSLLKGVALGIGATLMAALVPAWEAARTTPLAAQRRSRVEGRAHRALPWLVLVGVLLLGLSAALLWLAPRSLVAGFMALFALILGFSLWAPPLVLGLTRLLLPPFARLFGIIGRLAVRGIGASLSRTGVAVAALTVAVAATVGMGVMVQSFRGTVERWLGQTLESDLYVSVPGTTSSRVGDTLNPAVLPTLRGLDGVEALTLRRWVRLESEYGPVQAMVYQPAPAHRHRFPLKGDGGRRLWERYEAGEVVFISEPYAYHHRLGPGDGLSLMTPTGPHSFTVGGIFYDYGSEHGLVVLSRGLYRKWWNDSALSSVGLHLKAGLSPALMLTRLRQVLAEVPQTLHFRVHADILEATLTVFDRTFTITHVLRLLVILVAFVGILSALMALQLERAREYAVLRATGVTPGGLFALVSLQTGLMGLLAGLLALPLGLVLAKLLIVVINQRAFGWSLQTLVPAQVLFEALLLSLGAALLAGLYPAWRMSRTQPAAALREE